MGNIPVSLEDAMTYEFTWHTFSVEPCGRCRDLENYTWTQSKLEGVLIHPEQGEVWDLDADVSLMHGGSGTCQCYLEINPYVDLEKTPLWNEVKLLFEGAHQEVPSNIAEAKAEVQDLSLAMDITYKELRQLEAIMFRVLLLARKAGLGEDQQQMVTRLMHVISILRILQRSLWLLEAQTGPIGWVIGGLGFVVAGASALEMT
jgi:hypothetical protein